MVRKLIIKEQILISLEEPKPNHIGRLAGGFLAILIAQKSMGINIKSMKEAGFYNE